MDFLNYVPQQTIWEAPLTTLKTLRQTVVEEDGLAILEGYKKALDEALLKFSEEEKQ